MHEMQTTLAQEVVADLEDFFQAAQGTDVPWASARLLRPAVRRNIKLAECPSFGQTIFEYAPSAAGAADYEALARNLTGAPDPAAEPKTETPTTASTSPEPTPQPVQETNPTPHEPTHSEPVQTVEPKPEPTPTPEHDHSPQTQPESPAPSQVEPKPESTEPTAAKPNEVNSNIVTPGSWIDDSPYGYPT